MTFWKFHKNAMCLNIFVLFWKVVEKKRKKNNKNEKDINRKLQHLKAAHFLAWLAQAVEINLFRLMLFCVFAAVVDILVCCSGLVQRLTARFCSRHTPSRSEQYNNSVASPSRRPSCENKTTLHATRHPSGAVPQWHGGEGAGEGGGRWNLCLFVVCGEVL